jgi:hypothetical protein
MFKPVESTLSLYSKEKQTFKNVPLNEEGKIDPSIQSKVKDFLTDRDVELESSGPKKLEDKDFAKISEITAFLTGKVSASYEAKKQAGSEATSDDLVFNEDSSTGSSVEKKPASTTSSEDDFFDEF